MELKDAFTRADNDPHIFCTVITGSEKVFAAGADNKNMANIEFTDLFMND